MHLGKPLEEQFKYTLYDGSIIHELGYTSEEKDIGVIIDSNLEFDKHVYFKVNKANSTTLKCLINVPVRVFISKKMPPYTGLIRHYTFIKLMCLYWPVKFLEKATVMVLINLAQSGQQETAAIKYQCQRLLPGSRVPGTLPKSRG